ncbi:MAG TPA: hypothetical protein VGE09_06515 [Pseudoxanthomonas sp.]
MTVCKVCGLDQPKLARCHIYPDSMTKEAAGPSQEMAAMYVRDGVAHAAPAIAGLFDDNIVCPDCERLFGPADQYAINFRRDVLALRGRFTTPMGLQLPHYDADAAMLHAFAMNTLLRALLSDRWEYRAVHDPAIAAEVIPTLTGQGRTIDSGRGVALLFTTGDLGSMAASPTLRDVPGTPVYVIQLPNMQLVIAASPAGLIPGFDAMQLQAGQPVRVWRRRRPIEEELKAPSETIAATGARVDRIFAGMRRKPR